MHTRELLDNKRLDSEWVIKDAKNLENVLGKEYKLEVITRTLDSVIFGAPAQGGSTSRVFKYTYNCSTMIKYWTDCYTGKSDKKCQVPNRSLLDPLVDEYLIMNTLGVSHPEIPDYVPPVPYAYALSKTSPVRAMIETAKIRSDVLEHEEYVGICDRMGVSFRGIEEDYVGIDIGDYFKRLRKNLREITYMTEAIAVTRRMVGLMWRFHDLGFIHGDFHAGNGAFRVKKSSGVYSALRDEMVLIDFGFAEFIPQAFGVGRKSPMRPNLNEAFLSPWHLGGYRIGRRDDLYRVMETTAKLLAFMSRKPSGRKGLDLNNMFESVWEEGITEAGANRKLRKVKKNFFDYHVASDGGFYCCRKRPSFTFPSEPVKYLKKAMDMILGMNHPDQRPEYEKIIRELNMALFSLDPGTAELLEELLIEDTTPLPNGPSSYGRQIVQIDESEFPEDPLKEFGGRNKISRGTT